MGDVFWGLPHAPCSKDNRDAETYDRNRNRNVFWLRRTSARVVLRQGDIYRERSVVERVRGHLLHQSEGCRVSGTAGNRTSGEARPVGRAPRGSTDLIRAILQARRELSDPAVLSAALVKYLELDPKEAQEAAEDYLDHKVWDLNGSWTAEVLQFNLDFFETAGAIQKGLTPDQVADLAPLNAVLDEIGRK
jgi:hypothetical protein